MTRLMRTVSVVLPAIGLLVAALVFGGGFMHRAGYAAVAGTNQDPASAFTDGRPNLVAAMFYSAWCGSCAELEPRLREAAPAFDGRAVEFARFDFTLGQAGGLARQADALGVADVYAAHKGETGFMALVDRRTGAMIDTITRSDSEFDIFRKIEAAIASVS